MTRFLLLLGILISSLTLRAQSSAEIGSLSADEAYSVLKMCSAGLQEPREVVPGTIMKVTLTPGLLTYDYSMPRYRRTSRDLARLLICCNKPAGDNMEAVMMFADLIEHARCDIAFRYSGIDTASFRMKPDEFRLLMTRPANQIGLDMSEMLPELIATLDRQVKQADVYGFDNSRSSISADGEYLTVKMYLNIENKSLAHNTSSSEAKQIMASILLNSPLGMYSKAVFEAAKALDFKGLKYEFSDIAGNHGSLTFDWNEMENLAKGIKSPEEMLDAYDRYLTEDIQKTYPNIRFSHSTIPGNLTFNIIYDFPSDVFQRILECTPESGVKETYRPILQQVLPQMPDIKIIRIILVNSDSASRVQKYGRDDFSR